MLETEYTLAPIGILHSPLKQRERAPMHLDQVPEEPLHRPGQAAVHHHRPRPAPVRRRVLEPELRRHVEVDLDGGEAPLPPGGGTSAVGSKENL